MHKAKNCIASCSLKTIFRPCLRYYFHQVHNQFLAWLNLLYWRVLVAATKQSLIYEQSQTSLKLLGALATFQ